MTPDPRPAGGGPERTLLAGFAGDRSGGSRSLAELERLVETAGGETVAAVLKRRTHPDPATLIGRGKAGEMAALVRDKSIDLVVIDDDLTPAQQRHLEEIIPAKVIDRTRLILDIFAGRAHTNEGKLQVELAQLNYLLPRITSRFGRFEQQTGGIGTRGPGERKLETDQRRIRDRIVRIRREIGELRRQRSLRRSSRERVPLPVVALVGYTNVGKSTLLNALRVDRSRAVYADDKLFATLDPTARRVKLPGGRPALFVDTVGFIQKLPHHLVDAFHATLEAAVEADVLLHVVDASHPDWQDQRRMVEAVLKDLKAEEVPRLDVFNKADCLSQARQASLRKEGRLTVSATREDGLDRLLARTEEILERNQEEREFFLPHNRRDLLPVFYGAGRVLKETPAEDGVLIRARLDPLNWGRLEKELQRRSQEI